MNKKILSFLVTFAICINSVFCVNFSAFSATTVASISFQKVEPVTMQFDGSDFTMSYINSMVSEYYFLDGDTLTVTYSDGTTADYVYSSSDEKFISDDGSYIRDTVVDAYPYKYQSWAYGENKVAVEYSSAITYDTVTAVEASHTEGEAVIENNVDPTCEETGSYDTVVYCTVCGAELSRVTTTVEATGHSYVATETVNATCTEDGYIVYTCENDESHTYTEVLEALGHDYEIVETDATCTRRATQHIHAHAVVKHTQQTAQRLWAMIMFLQRLRRPHV